MIWQAPHMLWLLLALPAFVLLWWRGNRRLPWSVLSIRLLIIGLLITALADPVWPQAGAPARGPLIVLYDQSDSLTPAGQAAIRAEAEAIAAAAGPTTRLLAFGANLVAGSDRLPDGSGSDLAAALRMARQLLPAGGRVILITDGHSTGGNALVEAALAAQNGIRIDVSILSPPALPEAAITRLDAPMVLQSGEAFELTITTEYRSALTDAPLMGQLRVWANDQLLAEEQIVFPAGQYQFTIDQRAGEPGLIRFRAELLPAEADTFAANNVASATALVVPPPTVLLVEGFRDAGAALGAALGQNGMTIERMAVAQLPASLDRLTRFDGIVLIDVSATQLTFDQMASLREFVRSEGRGLTVIGGRQSFTLGGYAGTPLAEALPLLMEPPPRPQRAPVSLLLIIDRSASMSAAFGISKFDMAKEAAILALNALQPTDRIGVLAFDTDTLWTVPFQEVGNGATMAAIQNRIATMPLGGGTNIERALAVGLTALAGEPYTTRHAVLLSDGRSYSNNYARYQQLMETARAAQITLSTIAIGLDADTELLDQLARWGGGRYYFTADAADLPRLALRESEIASAELTVETPMAVLVNQPHPVIRNLNPATMPQIDGYIALKPRPDAAVALVSAADDPVLAVWQYGLGRSVAWTTSAAAPWASGWLAWPEYDRFWAQIVRYTLPAPNSGPLQVWVEPTERGARLVADAQAAGGAPIDLAQVSARVTLPDGSTQSFNLAQAAPGRYTRDLDLRSPGPYAITVALFANGQTLQRALGYAVAPPAEYALRSTTAIDQDAELARQIAALTGGNVGKAIAIEMESGFTSAAPALWPALAGLALALWLLEIAVRRRHTTYAP